MTGAAKHRRAGHRASPPSSGCSALLVWKVASRTTRRRRRRSSPRASTRLRRRSRCSASIGSGPAVDRRQLRGKAVVVNFWASWCIPCKDEAPALQATYERYRKQGLVVLGVDVEDFRQDAARFAKRYGLTYPIVRDTKKLDARHVGCDRVTRRRSSSTARDSWSASASREASTPNATASATRRASGSLSAPRRSRCDGASPRARVASALGALAARRLRRGERPPRAGRPRGGDRLPDLQDDARPVELADRDPDEDVHPGADRRR